MKLHRIFILLCFIIVYVISFACGESESEIPENKKILDIFLLIGQSNMQGVAPIEELDKIVLENVYLFNFKEEWEPATNYTDNGINRYSTVKKKPQTLFGPGYTFGRKIANYSNSNIGIVSNARGATRIQWWQKGYEGENDFNLYEEAVKRVKSALENSPSGTKIKGILWHQGEANNAGGRHIQYMEYLQALVKDLREDLGDPDLPFIVGEVGTWNDRGLNINPILRSVKTHIAYTDWVSSDGLTSIDLEKNDPHFDNLSQRVLGGRYADAAASLVYKIKIAGVTLFSNNDFRGRSILLGEGDYSGKDLESMGILIDEISSAKIDDNFELILNTSSGTQVIANDNANIKDYKIQSIRIAKRAK